MRHLVIGLVLLAAMPAASARDMRHPPGMYVGGPGFWIHEHVPADAPLREDLYGGVTCGFSSSGDHTGLVVNDPTKQTGEVECGPLTLANSAGGTIGSVTMTATFQVNNGAHGAGGVSRSSTLSGNVGYLADTVSFNAAAGDDVYYCTSFSWTSSKGGGSTVYDADDVTPGDQCALASYTED